MSKKTYNVQQAVLLEYAGEIAEYLGEDLPSFIEFDPDLNETKRQQLIDLVNQSLSFGTDNTQKGILKEKTGALKTEMLKCHKLFETVRYFAKKKFGENEAITRQFRIKDYQKVRFKQDKLVVFMFELAETIEKYRNDLISAGMKEADIDAIKSAAEALNKTNTLQETGKSERMMNTDQRITLLNDIYAVLSDFNHASKIVFADDPIRRERYYLPANNDSNAEDENDGNDAAE